MGVSTALLPFFYPSHKVLLVGGHRESFSEGRVYMSPFYPTTILTSQFRITALLLPMQVSRPGPPLRTSRSPVPPRSTSLPERPARRSDPPRPINLSFPPRPKIASRPAVPGSRSFPRLPMMRLKPVGTGGTGGTGHSLWWCPLSLSQSSPWWCPPADAGLIPMPRASTALAPANDRLVNRLCIFSSLVVGSEPV